MANGIIWETCNTIIGKSAHKLQCRTCKKWYDTKCSGVSKVNARLLYERKTAWLCHYCLEERTLDNLGAKHLIITHSLVILTI